MQFLRCLHLLILVTPIIALADPAQDEASQKLADYSYGLNYIIMNGSGVVFAAPPDNPLQVNFAIPDAGEVEETIAVWRNGELLYNMEEVWVWANIQGTMIDAGRSEAEEEFLRNAAAVSGAAYQIKQPRLLVTEGSIRFHGLGNIDGIRVDCSEGGIALTNNNGRDREYGDDFSIEWQEGTLCTVGDRKFRNVAGIWGYEPDDNVGVPPPTMPDAGGVL